MTTQTLNKDPFEGLNVIPVTQEEVRKHESHQDKSATISYPNKEIVYVNNAFCPVAYIGFGVAITLFVIYFMKKLQNK